MKRLDPRLFAWTALLPPNTRVQVHCASSRKLPKAGSAQLLSRDLSRSNEAHTVSKDRATGIAWYGDAELPSNLLHQYQFAVVPSLDNPRWFIPIGNPVVARAALQLYSPFRKKARVLRSVLSFIAGTRACWWRNNTLTLHLSEPSPLDHFVQEVLGPQKFSYALFPGHPDNGGKVTVIVIDATGTRRAIAKISTNEYGQSKVLAETKALSILSSTTLAPELLATRSNGIQTIALQSFLHGKNSPGCWTALHENFLAQLPRADSMPIEKLPLVLRLKDRCAKESKVKQLFGSQLDHVLREVAKENVNPVLTHGDFAPWNLRIHTGSISAFDWEYSDVLGLPLYDRFHFAIQTNLLLRKACRSKLISDICDIAAQASEGLTTSFALRLAQLTLISIALRQHRIPDEPTATTFLQILEAIENRILQTAPLI